MTKPKIAPYAPVLLTVGIASQRRVFQRPLMQSESIALRDLDLAVRDAMVSIGEARNALPEHLRKYIDGTSVNVILAKVTDDIRSLQRASMVAASGIAAAHAKVAEPKK